MRRRQAASSPCSIKVAPGSASGSQRLPINQAQFKVLQQQLNAVSLRENGDSRYRQRRSSSHQACGENAGDSIAAPIH